MNQVTSSLGNLLVLAGSGFRLNTYSLLGTQSPPRTVSLASKLDQHWQESFTSQLATTAKFERTFLGLQHNS
jgi:hypothetical protein